MSVSRCNHSRPISAAVASDERRPWCGTRCARP
jgi:hypothetical protein